VADSKNSNFLLCYDIADPKRLGRVHRCLKKHGLPVQYSVFTADLNRLQVESLLEQCTRLIDLREDDVRCYTLPAGFEFDFLGRQTFPDDVMLFSASGINRLQW
jgi:CRISPR-associated protein Cas2